MKDVLWFVKDKNVIFNVKLLLKCYDYLIFIYMKVYIIYEYINII